MDFSKYSLKTNVENEIEINIQSKKGRPRDQPEACEIETVMFWAKSPESAVCSEDETVSRFTKFLIEIERWMESCP